MTVSEGRWVAPAYSAQATPLGAIAPALVAGNLQHAELADQGAEDDRAVAGYGFRFGLTAEL